MVIRDVNCFHYSGPGAPGPIRGGFIIQRDAARPPRHVQMASICLCDIQVTSAARGAAESVTCG